MLKQSEFTILEENFEAVIKAEKAVGRAIGENVPDDKWKEIQETARKAYRAFYDQLYKMRLENIGC